MEALLITITVTVVTVEVTITSIMGATQTSTAHQILQEQGLELLKGSKAHLS